MTISKEKTIAELFLHEYLGIPETVRASLYFYNTYSEVDVFVSVLKELMIPSLKPKGIAEL